MGTATVTIDCNACKADQSMKATKVARFGGILRVIGYIIATPSLLGVLLAGVLFWSTAMAASEVLAEATTDAGMYGATVGAGIGYGIAIFTAGVSLVGGLIGWLLLMKRKVFRCLGCGFILDRA